MSTKTQSSIAVDIDRYPRVMTAYSLDLEGPDGNTYVPSHDFPNEMGPSDTFTYNGWTWRVTEVARKQFDAPGEPELTLRCIAV
jgi:hypothetical protein